MFPCPHCHAFCHFDRPCPRCGWLSNPNASFHALQAADAKGASLVRLSTAIMACAALVLVGGIALGIALGSISVGLIGALLGFVGLVGSAVVGQVGRAHQGRII